MDAIQEDRFVVYLRAERHRSERRECVERPVADCSTYAEARQIRQACHDSGRECVIRFIGPAGGGD
jgi:hypothetical protein